MAAQHELHTVYRFVLRWRVEDAAISAFRAAHFRFLDLSANKTRCQRSFDTSNDLVCPVQGR